jgi:hypothetical protein
LWAIGASWSQMRWGLEVGHCRSNRPRELAHDYFPMRIHSDEVKATLAEIHSDRSNAVIVRSDVGHSCSFSRISCVSAAFPFTRLERGRSIPLLVDQLLHDGTAIRGMTAAISTDNRSASPIGEPRSSPEGK